MGVKREEKKSRKEKWQELRKREFIDKPNGTKVSLIDILPNTEAIYIWQTNMEDAAISNKLQDCLTIRLSCTERTIKDISRFFYKTIIKTIIIKYLKKYLNRRESYINLKKIIYIFICNYKCKLKIQAKMQKEKISIWICTLIIIIFVIFNKFYESKINILYVYIEDFK